MTDDALDRWLVSRLDSLHDSLDDVLDLERGLADVTLPRAHAEIVNDLAHVLDLDAGLAEAVSPPRERHAEPPERLVSVADELTALPPVERIATRAWLPVKLLADAEYLTEYTPRLRALASSLDDPSAYAVTRGAALAEAQHLADSVKSPALQPLADALAALLRCEPPIAHDVVRGQANITANRLGTELRALLGRICRHRHGPGLSQRFANGFSDAAELHLIVGSRDIAAFEAALRGPIERMLTAVSSMVGADLEQADLDGVPLDGVRWSTDTRWPRDWREWVHGNSVPVSPGVFEIRVGSTGTNSYVLT